MADEAAPADQLLHLQKLYIKKLSFQSPKAPEVFIAPFDAENLVNINSISRHIDASQVEVALTLRVQSLVGEDTIFQVELVQAGLFTIEGYTPDERTRLLGSVCPGVLYPYAREAMTDIANNGGFPDLLLQPLDFDALYARSMQERAAQASGDASGEMT
jgi:preprotein translocase subunit SecB